MGLIAGWEHPLEKEMATHSSILPWETPRTEEPGRLQTTGSQKGWTPLREKDTKHETTWQDILAKLIHRLGTTLKLEWNRSWKGAIGFNDQRSLGRRRALKE